MSSGADLKALIATTEALIGQVQKALQAAGDAAAAQAADEAARKVARRRQQHEEDMRRFVFEQVSLAQQKPVLNAPSLEAEPGAQFARRVRRRRTLV